MRTWLLLPVAALLLAGCAGYHIGPIKPTYLKKVNTIAVPSFKNETLVPRLEVMLANNVISQLQQDGTYQIGTMEDADAILEGKIVSIDRQAARSLVGNVLATTEFNLLLKIDYTLTDRITGKQLAKRTVIGTTSFFVGGDVQQDEQQALPLAAEKAAVQIVSYLSEGW
jgi:PBP1b-binding outer membrane lipoprotein LpoB